MAGREDPAGSTVEAHIGWSNVRIWRLERIRQLCDRHGWTAPVAVQQQHSHLRPKAGNASVSIVGA